MCRTTTGCAPPNLEPARDPASTAPIRTSATLERGDTTQRTAPSWSSVPAIAKKMTNTELEQENGQEGSREDQASIRVGPEAARRRMRGDEKEVERAGAHAAPAKLRSAK
jgi:hypothetical protein